MASNSNAATDAVSKIDAAAEKAYAEAAASTAAAPKAKAEKKAANNTASKKAVTKKAPAKKAAPKITAEKKKTSSKKAAAKFTKKPKKTKSAGTPVTKLKDTIMAKAKETNVTDTVTKGAKDMAADVQARVKTAAAKAGEFAGEMNEFNKGNIEAVVESGKVFFAGAQEMGRENLSTGKTIVETVAADVKKMAAVKSPTELIQLQGELARRNVDAAISFGSKNTENWLKIYNDAFAPISSRVSVATSRFKKAA